MGNHLTVGDVASQAGVTSKAVVSWYGIPARIVADQRGHCDIAPFGVSLPHPSLVNAVIRRGIPERTKIRLIFLHEFGHLQTLPVVVPYALLALRRRRPGWLGFLLSLVAVQGFWELLTEIYVVSRIGRADYVFVLRTARNPAALLFWPVMFGLTVLPFLRLEKRGAQAWTTASPSAKLPSASA